MKEIYIIRHGETDFNNLGIVQGKGVNSSINAVGRNQAEAFYQKYKDTGFERIYISTLSRTRETVAPFDNLNVPIEIHHGLDEISWGIHEGKSNGDTFREFYRILHLWQQGDPDIKMEEGESPREVQQRQLEFIHTIMPRNENKILICSHGRAIRILLCTLLGKDLSEMDTFPHHNTSLYKLNYDGNSYTIELFNDISHLNGKEDHHIAG